MNGVKRQIEQMFNFVATMATSVRQYVVIHINFPVVLLFTHQFFALSRIHHAPCRTAAVINFLFLWTNGIWTHIEKWNNYNDNHKYPIDRVAFFPFSIYMRTAYEQRRRTHFILVFRFHIDSDECVELSISIHHWNTQRK